MTPIRLPILFHTKDNLQLIELGLKEEDDDSDPEIRIVSFYHIDVVSPYNVDDNKYSCIYTGGYSFICPKTVEEVDAIILLSNQTLT